MTAISSSRGDGLTPGYSTWLRGREDTIRSVLAAADADDPDPHIDLGPSEFTTRAAGLSDGGSHQAAKQLVRYGLAVRVESRIYRNNNVSDRRIVYRLTDRGRDALVDRLEAVAERSGPLPCSESDTCRGDSFENPRGVDGVRCKDCQTVYSREEVRL